LKKTFEHLLGLNAADALAILKSCGIFDVRVTFTSAPAPLTGRAQTHGDGEPRRTDLLRAVAEQFQASEEDEPPYDPLLEPAAAGGMLTEARVVGVRDDGRQIIVSRFRVTPTGETRNEMRNVE
jgi:hypothetical protein